MRTIRKPATRNAARLQLRLKGPVEKGNRPFVDPGLTEKRWYVYCKGSQLDLVGEGFRSTGFYALGDPASVSITVSTGYLIFSQDS